MAEAPVNGRAFLAIGMHGPMRLVGSPRTMVGVQEGDLWQAIAFWDKWREPGRWVFSLTGMPLWSAPLGWQELVWPTPIRPL